MIHELHKTPIYCINDPVQAWMSILVLVQAHGKVHWIFTPFVRGVRHGFWEIPFFVEPVCTALLASLNKADTYEPQAQPIQNKSRRCRFPLVPFFQEQALVHGTRVSEEEVTLQVTLMFSFI